VKRRAFTLLEVVVAMTLAITLLSAGVALFLSARRAAIDAAQGAHVNREGQLALRTLFRDLSYLGVGLPPSKAICVDGGCGGQSLGSAVRVGRADGLVIFGDLPLPNAELNGLVALTRLRGDVDSAFVAISSELNGVCAPPNISAPAAMRCQTSRASLVPGAFTADDDCKDGALDARTCPWGLHKWVGTAANPMAVLAVEPSGASHLRSWRGAFADVDNAIGVQLDAPLPRAPFFAPIGGGFLTTLDRVAWSFEKKDGGVCNVSDGSCLLRRLQCWAAPSTPDDPLFPAPGSASRIASTTTLTGCGTATSTGWETVASGVTAFSLRYFSDNDTALPVPLSRADALRVRAIEVELTLLKGTERQTTRQRVLLEGRDVR
jgi:type II secretory pathway pseudopilin PulG